MWSSPAGTGSFEKRQRNRLLEVSDKESKGLDKDFGLWFIGECSKKGFQKSTNHPFGKGLGVKRCSGGAFGRVATQTGTECFPAKMS